MQRLAPLYCSVRVETPCPSSPSPKPPNMSTCGANLSPEWTVAFLLTRTTLKAEPKRSGSEQKRWPTEPTMASRKERAARKKKKRQVVNSSDESEDDENLQQR
mmetsp:Transcript_6814/g.14243  ORF Transcript_6814/g.14243 Transcript_6814/m.14243 type:complete len:103 (-) Transcript_6814:169-477(-)